MRRQTRIPVRFPLFGLWYLFVPYPSFIHTAYRVPLRSHAAGCRQRFSGRVNGAIGWTVGCLSTGCFQQIVYTPLLICEFLGQISSWALHHLTYQTLAHSLSYDFFFLLKKTDICSSFFPFSSGSVTFLLRPPKPNHRILPKAPLVKEVVVIQSFFWWVEGS